MTIANGFFSSFFQLRPENIWVKEICSWHKFTKIEVKALAAFLLTKGAGESLDYRVGRSDAILEKGLVKNYRYTKTVRTRLNLSSQNTGRLPEGFKNQTGEFMKKPRSSDALTF